ncbi:MAG: hypothetical protein RBG13Loki_0747 [Promethearchaeota archaeon CR_4]|nr:MAG: hypothetical protein RBG13Loki_0747 [Candidatus Lokiarchaeota archaeon CR_4]
MPFASKQDVIRFLIDLPDDLPLEEQISRLLVQVRDPSLPSRLIGEIPLNPKSSLIAEGEQRLADLAAKREQEFRQLETTQGEIVKQLKFDFEQQKIKTEAEAIAAMEARARLKECCAEYKVATKILCAARKEIEVRYQRELKTVVTELRATERTQKNVRKIN